VHSAGSNDHFVGVGVPYQVQFHGRPLGGVMNLSTKVDNFWVWASKLFAKLFKKI
jgi:hypothetical protein